MVDLGFIDGKRTRKFLYAATRKKVSKKLLTALGKQQRGAVVNTDDVVTVGTYLDNWLATISVRPKTKRQYEQVVRLYLKPAIGPVRLSRLEPDQVRALVRGLEERGLSTTTATLARNILRIALGQAVRDEVLGRNVAVLVRRPKAHRRDGATLSQDQARAFLDSLKSKRLEAVITCGIALGLRLGEVLGLQWGDLNLKAGRVTIRRSLQNLGKGRRELADVKSRESRRTLALPAFVVATLQRHYTAQKERQLAAGKEWQRSDFVFTTGIGRPMDGSLVTRDLKRILKATWMGGRSACTHQRNRDGACLDCSATRLPVVNFHGLRHSCASVLLAAGVPMRDVSELLGHSDVRLTLSTYAHVVDANRARLADTIDTVFAEAGTR
jgi:integrase